uniref:Uncharacterized protein n=1 Tax=Glossina palpalis gambiensis TaxID=67801 RepID=A0A1B0BAP4_9MUSC
FICELVVHCTITPFHSLSTEATKVNKNARQFFKSWSTTTTTTTAVVTASRTVNKSWSNSKHSVARSDATAFLIAITVWRNRRISNCSTPPPPCNPKAAVGLNGEFNDDVADVDFGFDVVDFLPRLTEPPVALALSFCNVDVVFNYWQVRLNVDVLLNADGFKQNYAHLCTRLPKHMFKGQRQKNKTKIRHKSAAKKHPTVHSPVSRIRYNACDECCDPEALITRIDYLLKDCDFDKRDPP